MAETRPHSTADADWRRLMPTDAELRKRYAALEKNEHANKIANWVLPNKMDKEKTDRDEVEKATMTSDSASKEIEKTRTDITDVCRALGVEPAIGDRIFHEFQEGIKAWLFMGRVIGLVGVANEVQKRGFMTLENMNLLVEYFPGIYGVAAETAGTAREDIKTRLENRAYTASDFAPVLAMSLQGIAKQKINTKTSWPMAIAVTELAEKVLKRP